MDPLLPYSLPLKGLGNGIHHFDYQVDGEFFKAIEGSPIEAAEVAMQVDLDKQPRLLVFEVVDTIAQPFEGQAVR